MQQRGYKTLYSPNVKIFHTGGVSTDQIIKGKEKQLFVLKNHLHSMMVINKILEGKHRVKNVDENS